MTQSISDARLIALCVGLAGGLTLAGAMAFAQDAPAGRPPDAATVTGRRVPDLDALGGSVHRVTEEQMRALDYSDPDRVVARIPGGYVRSEDGYGLRPNIGMRGANSHRSRRITLLEDGVLQAYAPYSSPSVFSLTPMTRVWYRPRRPPARLAERGPR